MNIQITSRKFRANESLKNYVKTELQSLQRFNDQIMDVNVVLSFTHLRDSIKEVEVFLQVPGKTLSASESSEDFYKSVNLAAEKLKRQLKIIKSKRKARVR